PLYYSAEWRALRLWALERDGWACTVCGWSVRGPGMARVDHIETVEERPDLALCLDNVRTLCIEHDNQSHREKGRRDASGKRVEQFTIRGCDENGFPLDPNHAWNL